MGSKVIPLSLEEVGWQLFMSVTIIEGQSCGETGHGDAVLDSSADCSAPRLLTILHSITEERVQQQVLQLSVSVKRLFDFTQEDTSDDAASSPHQCDRAVVKGPAKLYGCLSQQHEALCVGDDLGGVEGLEDKKDYSVIVTMNLN